MSSPALASAAAPTGAASAEAAQDLHLREWAMLQTTPSNAQLARLWRSSTPTRAFRYTTASSMLWKAASLPTSPSHSGLSATTSRTSRSWVCWRCSGAARISTARSPSGAWKMDVVLSSGQLALELPAEEPPEAQAGGDGSHAACDHEFHPVFSEGAGGKPSARIWRKAAWQVRRQ